MNEEEYLKHVEEIMSTFKDNKKYFNYIRYFSYTEDGISSYYNIEGKSYIR